MLKVLFFGDIVGRPSREILIKILPDLKKEYQSDFIIVNGENASHGFGLNKNSFNEILKAGVDIITSGNHIFDKEEAIELLQDQNTPLIRPLNYPSDIPGNGYKVLEKNNKKILVINALGRIFIKGEADDPFRAIDRVLKIYTLRSNYKKNDKKEIVDAIIVDWHAEATSEKMALGYYLDGRVSAVLGTHTHVQTADERILENGTAYISDVGMVGAKDSIIGIKKELILKSFLMRYPRKSEIPENSLIQVNGVLIEIKDNGLAENIFRIQRIAN